MQASGRREPLRLCGPHVPVRGARVPERPGLRRPPLLLMTRARREPRADHDLGIHTTRAVPCAALGIAGPNAVHASPYEPTPFGVLDDLLCGLGLELPRYTFVDLGSGKGRVICLAAGLPFRGVLGIELSPALHAAAEANLAALPASWRRARSVRSVCADAAEHPIPAGPTVYFLFNPFAASVLARVVARIEAAHADDPADRLVLYYMPVHRDVLDRSALLGLHSSSRDWLIYRSQA